MIFGLTLPATRLAVAEFDPLFVTAGRSLVAAALAAVTLLWARPQPPRRREWPRLAAFAAFSIIGFPLLMAIAMQYAPASHGAVVLAVLPLLTAMAGALVAGERPSLGFWACGVAGTGTVLIYSLLSRRRFRRSAVGRSAAGRGRALRRHGLCARRRDGAAHRRLGGDLLGARVLGAGHAGAGAAVAWPINWGASASAWAGFLYVSVFSMFLGFFAWNKGLAMGGIARVGQIQLLQPFVALAAACGAAGRACRLARDRLRPAGGGHRGARLAHARGAPLVKRDVMPCRVEDAPPARWRAP